MQSIVLQRILANRLFLKKLFGETLKFYNFPKA